MRWPTSLFSIPQTNNNDRTNQYKINTKSSRTRLFQFLVSLSRLQIKTSRLKNRKRHLTINLKISARTSNSKISTKSRQDHDGKTTWACFGKKMKIPDRKSSGQWTCVTSSATDAIGLPMPWELDEVRLSVLDAKTLNMQAHRMPVVGTMYYCGSYPDRCHPYWNLFAFQTLPYTSNPPSLSLSLSLSLSISLNFFFLPIPSKAPIFSCINERQLEQWQARVQGASFDSRQSPPEVNLENLTDELPARQSESNYHYWILWVNIGWTAEVVSLFREIRENLNWRRNSIWIAKGSST